MTDEVSIFFLSGFKVSQAVRGDFYLDYHLSLVSELYRVADQVDKNLAQPGHIGNENLRDGVVNDISEVQLFFSCFGRQKIKCFLDARMQIKRMTFKFKFAGFNFGKIKN